jgi:hypothetical protein
MFDTFLPPLKWAVFGNGIFMLLWMGFRITVGHPSAWVLFDAAISVASVVVAYGYHNEGV